MKAANWKTGATLKEGTDYTAKYVYVGTDYDQNVIVNGLSKVGAYEVTLTGKGSYKGTSSSTTLYVGNLKIEGNTAQKYTGKPITPALTLNWYDGESSRNLDEYDYALSCKNNVNPGTATATISGKGFYAGTATTTFQISKPTSAASSKTGATASTAKKKAVNPIKVKGKTATVKFKKLKKKAQKLSAKKVITVSKAQGKVTYKKTSGNKKIAIAKNGKVTVKKGLKKGTYKVKVKVTAAGNAKYGKATKTVTFKVKVK